MRLSISLVVVGVGFVVEYNNGDAFHGLKPSFKVMGGFEDGISHVEAKYPVLPFKQHLIVFWVV